MLAARILASSLQSQLAQLPRGLASLQLFSTSGEVTPDADTTTGAPGTGKGPAAADPKKVGGAGGPGAGSNAAGKGPSSGQLYGREDRDPKPSPNASLKQKHEGEVDRDFQNKSDPSLPGHGPSPDVTPKVADQLKQDESEGPRAAGQGVVENLAKKDPEQYGKDRTSPA